MPCGGPNSLGFRANYITFRSACIESDKAVRPHFPLRRHLSFFLGPDFLPRRSWRRPEANTVAIQGSVWERTTLGNGLVHVCFQPKDPNDATKGIPVKPTKSQGKKKKLDVNANLASLDDALFEMARSLLCYHADAPHTQSAAAAADLLIGHGSSIWYS